jgi:hypothetical protein
MESDHMVIGHAEHERVTIKILSYEHAPWYTAHVHVACGSFRGSFPWDVFAGELRQFGKDIGLLYRSLSGTARLEPMEPNLTLDMVGDGRGHIVVTGTAQATLGDDIYLRFRFTLDQTELPSIASALISADPVL